MKAILKMTRRSIRGSLGRFIALTMIIALSVGFFSGLKMTKGAMVKTLNSYTISQNMYDFRLASSLGFSAEDVDGFAAIDGVSAAEGSISRDALVITGNGERVFRIAGLPEEINLPSLISGRLPQNETECLVDADAVSEKNIGKTITLSSNNTEADIKDFAQREFTVVGICESPVYLGINRGISNVGSGNLNGYMYVLPKAFGTDIFSDVYLTFSKDAAIYTDEYDELIASRRGEVASACEKAAGERYRSILGQNGLTEETAPAAGISPPRTYVLTRNENQGYAGFENDTSIVSGIANVFPVFFMLVAMLVCVTTMTRMVSEERTQIGTLKATGYSDKAITAKYLLYSGVACTAGWCGGFFLGTWGIPKVFWLAYAKLYDFGSLEYEFSLTMFAATFLFSITAIVGSSYLSCRKELIREPAALIRPAAPKSGRRILLERIGFIWNRMRFIPKAVTRNIFRYKKRLVMMIIGISGCTALLATGFGVRDSLLHVGDIQYGELHKYDYSVTLSGSSDVLSGCDFIEKYIPLTETRLDICSGDASETVQLLSFKTDDISDFIDLKGAGFPRTGETAVSSQAAAKLGVKKGDTVTFRTSDMKEIRLTVSGVFENYIYNYAIVSAETYEQNFGEWRETSAFVNTDDSDASRKLMKLGEISGINSADDRRKTLDDSLSCLNYIILMVVFFAGSLSFIVIYNLTNINLAERSREIATIKVLGFNSKETKSYILRENIIMAAAAGIVGIPLGILLHRFVLHSINIDNIAFPVRMQPSSIAAAFALTVFFALLVNIYMKRRVEKIPMAESLKTVE